MTCSQIRSLLDDYLDRELPADETQQVADHLEVCPDCRAEYESSARMIGLLAEHTAPEPEAGYWEEVQDLIVARTVDHAPVVDLTAEIDRRRSERVSFLRSILAVAASLAIFFTALWLSPEDLGGPARPWLAGTDDIRPEAAASTAEFREMLSADERDMVAGSILLVGSPGLLGGSAELTAMLGVGPGR